MIHSSPVTLLQFKPSDEVFSSPKLGPVDDVGTLFFPPDAGVVSVFH
jgi:hypothetical protein